MKRILITIPCVLALMLSCTKEDLEIRHTDNDFSGQQIQMTEAEAQQEFAVALSKAVAENEQLRTFIRDEALSQFDKDYDVFYPFVKNQTVSDGLTFRLKGVFVDSMRTCLSDEHAQGEVRIDRICGPVEKVSDTTFAVRFYRMGMHNPRRTGEIWLLASQEGDARYKSAVQQLVVKIPYRNAGRRQHILFPGLDDVEAGTESVALHAESDCGLPVHYYVKEGPARITKNDMLEFTPIPPRSRFPIKVTVVAWQYGLNGKVQTAEPVERSFYIYK